MALFTKDQLTAQGVAKILFSTPAPSSSQVQDVLSLFASGRLKGQRVVSGQTTSWTTTSAAVAAYMAQASYRRQLATRGSKSTIREADLGHCYRSLLQDYFQAVVFRRRAQSRRYNNGWFRGSVVAGQAVLVAFVFTITVFSIGWFSPGPSAEQVAIECWISQRADRYQITRWHEACDTGQDRTKAIRVEYRYSHNNRHGVHTDRTFLICDNEVLSVDSSDGMEN